MEKPTEEMISLIPLKDTLERFRDQLLKLDYSESYYILTALANIAISREPKEREFIEVRHNLIHNFIFKPLNLSDDRCQSV